MNKHVQCNVQYNYNTIIHYYTLATMNYSQKNERRKKSQKAQGIGKLGTLGNWENIILFGKRGLETQYTDTRSAKQTSIY